MSCVINYGMRKLFDSLKEHTTCVYTFLFTFIIASSLLIFQEIKHASEMIKTHQEQQLLIKFIDENNIIFYGQRDSILDLEDEMHDLKMQNTEQGLFIQKIILYLKRIDHWPPKIPPNELGDSGSEA